MYEDTFGPVHKCWKDARPCSGQRQFTLYHMVMSCLLGVAGSCERAPDHRHREAEQVPQHLLLGQDPEEDIEWSACTQSACPGQATGEDCSGAVEGCKKASTFVPTPWAPYAVPDADWTAPIR